AKDLLDCAPDDIALVANKCEGGAGAGGLYEAYGLGLGDPVPVSAAHGEGMILLFEALLPHADRIAALEAEQAYLQQAEDAMLRQEQAQAAEETAKADGGPDGATSEQEDEDFPDLEPDPDPRGERPLRLAVVGRPNTGKSTLVNCFIQEDRLLTGPEAGVTRDAIEVDWEWRGRRIRLVDTAGLRRKARIEKELEKLSAADTLDAIRLAEVCILLLDAEMPLEKQELAIARHVIEEGRALVIGINKWDLCKNRKEALKFLTEKIETSLPQVRGIPAVTLSALTGQGLDDLMEAVQEIHEIWNMRISTSKLNRWLEEMVSRHPPPIGKHGRRLKLRYLTQIKGRPPTFAVFMSRPEDLPEDYKRYLIGGLRR
ncbi:MAG: ribosome biogenesis GTPase Der, partial [Rhodospirillaceae bacterium]